MTTYNKICRVCSSPANYEIFAKIPTYLHANTHEFVNWQKPINILLEETTGLKVTPEDGLPSSICALCISYLKHAATFREQAIKNTLTLKGVQILEQYNTSKKQSDGTKAANNKIKDDNEKSNGDKESLLVTAEDLMYSDEREVDANLLANNYQQDQSKVHKQLLNNSSQGSLPTIQDIEQQMRYLNLLFGKEANAGLRGKRQNNNSGAEAFDFLATGSGGDAEDDVQTTSSVSSDENDARITKDRNLICNMFTYKEKNFEEDDVMDMEELRAAITINLPESWKERKCRACARRFMFADSYREHIDTCIEHKFLTFIEDVNRLLEIRRNKGISPHEFIRRMIFCVRKTCDWLKTNCNELVESDTLSNDKESTTAAVPLEPTENILLEHTSTKASDSNAESSNSIRRPSFITPKPLRSTSATPITVSNNILYEIERSQSRNSNQQLQNDLNFTLDECNQLKRPIALLATTTTTTTTATINCNITNNSDQQLPINSEGTKNGNKDDSERLTFLQKLQQAGGQTPPPNKSTVSPYSTPSFQAIPTTPKISVRKDLLKNIKPLQDVSTVTATTTTFSARCNPCNLFFDTLVSLEMHNALHHNNSTATKTRNRINTDADEFNEAEQQRNRIIALFEDDDNDDI